MSRSRNTPSRGGAFSDEEKRAVWRKGKVVPGYDPGDYRKDACGDWMKWSSYGTTGKYGWEIDHIKPASKGGGDELSNLQPLYWENNRSKGDDYPHWNCAVRAR